MLFRSGPVDSTRVVVGGSWSVYWYNGQMISSEIARGMDLTTMTPSQYVSQNEIDASNTVHFEYLNAQGQPKLIWPPSFALAKAYTDQMERKGCFSGRIAAIRSGIAAAEKASGSDRSAALTALSASLEADARSGCDDKKVDLLRKSLQDLRTIA